MMKVTCKLMFPKSVHQQTADTNCLFVGDRVLVKCWGRLVPGEPRSTSQLMESTSMSHGTSEVAHRQPKTGQWPHHVE